MINAYIVGYIICQLGFSISIGILVDAKNKREKEKNESEKTKLTGRMVGGGFGVALSIITSLVIGYYHYNEQKSLAETILNNIATGQDFTVDMCKGLFDDEETISQFTDMASNRPKYEWQNMCKQQATNKK